MDNTIYANDELFNRVAFGDRYKQNPRYWVMRITSKSPRVTESDYIRYTMRKQSPKPTSRQRFIRMFPVFRSQTDKKFIADCQRVINALNRDLGAKA